MVCYGGGMQVQLRDYDGDTGREDKIKEVSSWVMRKMKGVTKWRGCRWKNMKGKLMELLSEIEKSRNMRGALGSRRKLRKLIKEVERL